MSYDLFKEYYYLPEKSKGNAYEDVIFIPNIPMFASGSSMKDAGYFTLMGFKATVNTMVGENVVLPTFVNRTVDQVIWGYDDPLTKMGREFSEGLKSDKFGLMAGTNYTMYGRFRSHTGQGDLSSLGQIRAFNGEENYHKWSDPECDKIRGGDGSFMSPNLDLNSR